MIRLGFARRILLPTLVAWRLRESAAFTALSASCLTRSPSSYLYVSASFTEPSDSNFGRREYWNEVYENSENEEAFSWYSSWTELEPFVRELVPSFSHVLIPGMGNDGAVVDMYDAGYRNITAFDYAEAGVECAQTLLGSERIRECANIHRSGVGLLVADARNLQFDDNSFDAVLDKGTLDAIYLSGGRNKTLAAHHLAAAVSELGRVVVENGVVISVTAACVDAVQQAFDNEETIWEQIRDGTPYMTEDGYASNNVDGTSLAWSKRTA